MMKILAGALAGLGFMAAMAAPAAAQVATYTANFGAGFASGPDAIVDGSFSLTFDDAADALGSVTSVDITVDGGPHFTTADFIFTKASNSLVIGNNCNSSVCSVASGTDQFFFEVVDLSNPLASSPPPFMLYSYVGAPGGAAYTSDYVEMEFNRTPVDNVVPEPTVWALMILGFAGLGFAARRRRAPRLPRANSGFPSRLRISRR